MLYPSRGIMVRYEAEANLDYSTPDPTMLLCPGEQGLKTKSWDPERKDAKEFVQGLIEYENDILAAQPMLPLAVATEMDIDDFYQQTLDPDK